MIATVDVRFPRSGPQQLLFRWSPSSLGLPFKNISFSIAFFLEFDKLTGTPGNSNFVWLSSIVDDFETCRQSTVVLATHILCFHRGTYSYIRRLRGSYRVFDAESLIAGCDNSKTRNFSFLPS